MGLEPGSFGFGWFDILLMNFPEFVASPGGFKSFRLCFGIVTHCGQGQYRFFNLEEGSDNFADAISLWWWTSLDGGIQLLWVFDCRQYNRRIKPKVRIPVKME